MKRFYFIAFLLLTTVQALAQSTNRDFPTPILQNEISATIAARDVGDSRLTSHYYTFYANNGDLLLEIETANLNGDIDLYLIDEDSRPLSKIPLFADDVTKTQRSVYLRKRERIVLRVEGRTPNDDAASYKIKLIGGFEVASNLPAPPEDVSTKVVIPNNDNVAKVNSVGTIIEQPRKPEPTPKPEPIRKTTLPRTPRTTAKTTPRQPRTTRKPKSATVATNDTTNEPTNETAETKVVTNDSTEKEPVKTPSSSGNRRPRAKKPAKSAPKTETTAKENAPNPLENVRFVLLLKDGYKIERPMSEILRLNVDKTMITVITKNGKIERFDILDVAKMSIE